MSSRTFMSWLGALLQCTAAATAQPVGILEGMKAIFLGRKQKQELKNPQKLQVIGAGLPRTGTGSLYKALEILGFHPYHMMKVIEDSSHAALWAALANGDASIDSVFSLIGQEGFNATLDWPASDYFQDQMRLYPEARVLLSVRDNATAWAHSYRTMNRLVRLIYEPFSLSFPSPLPLLFPKWLADMQAVRCGFAKVVLEWERCLVDDLAYFQDNGWLEEQYERHVNFVKAHVPPERLLVFNVKQGWGPLCQFLGTSVPDIPFPRYGDSSTLRRASVVARVIAYGWIPMIAFIIIVLCRQIWKCRTGFLTSKTKND